MSSPSPAGGHPLESLLGHRFADAELLHRALVHRSYTAEHPEEASNERLEFLGDAVLSLVVSDLLLSRYRHLVEGEMAKVRAATVNRDELAEVAMGIGLGDHLLLGRGEDASGGRKKGSILADTMEALLAALYLDGGIEAARRFIVGQWADRVAERASEPGRRDYKTRVQEVLAGRGSRPVYLVEGEGPDHRRSFRARLRAEGRVMGVGEGHSKKEAEQEAARRALESLQAEG